MRNFWLGLLLGAAMAQAQTWEMINPAGTGDFRWFAIDGKDVITLSGQFGTYWSADQGKTWSGGSRSVAPVKFTYHGTVLPSIERNAFLACPDGDLFSIESMNKGTWGDWPIALFRSTDHGFNWESVSDSLPYDPAAPNSLGWDLQCGPNGNLYILYGTASNWYNALRISRDKGRTWEKHGELAGYSEYAINPDGDLYCLGFRERSIEAVLFRSSDDGVTWDSLYNTHESSGTRLVVGKSGSVALIYLNVLSGMFAGETSIRKSPLNYLGNSATAFAISPEHELFAGAAYRGVVKVNKAMDKQFLRNGGLGADTTEPARKLRFDSRGNLYYLAGDNLYFMTAEEVAIRPGLSKRTFPSAVREYDPTGRRVELKSPTRVPIFRR